MDEPKAAVDWLVAHRLKREQKVIEGLQKTGRTVLDDLVKVVYDDVDTSLHKMAKLSLSAHLIKLLHEDRALQHMADDSWELSDA